MPQRHQLAWLSDAGWQPLLAGAWDAQALEAIAHWAEHELPLVVTQQGVSPAASDVPAQEHTLALGLPAPVRFGRRRLALRAPPDAVRAFGAFPLAPAIEPLLMPALRGPWLALAGRLARLGCDARVYGSHGWQALTGLAYLHEASDIDLLLPVPSAAVADAICAELAAMQAAEPAAPRLDGELLFADGAGVAWREWQQWRGGAVQRLLVKRIDGVALEDRLAGAAGAMRAAC